jgi:NhaP-type Na+/H+ or K+/H+ antiporter
MPASDEVAVTTNEILFGVGLTVALAVGSQILASRLRIPAIVVLLPVGFVAGALTDDINPDRLLGAAFEPLVGLAVAVILYDAGLGLDLRRLTGHTRRVVLRLLGLGVVVTWFSAALIAVPLLGLTLHAALMLGVILVVSGPTVVAPLLDFIRPSERLRHILAWEGSLIDPVGGVLGALVFHGIASAHKPVPGSRLLEFLLSVAVGLLGGAVGVVLLWLLLHGLKLGDVYGSTAQLASVVAVAAGCDIVREDTGLIAAIVMGLAVANVAGFENPIRRPFFETLVQLVIGLLFVSISSTVTPQSLRGLVLPTLGLVAVLALLVRPFVAWVSTLRTDLTRGEREFVGWMAPRGIVAAATASTFSAGLIAAGVGGADKILPVTFLVIVATVTLYGLTAAPVARGLGVTRGPGSRILVVGGDPWVIDLGRALRTAGVEVLAWAGPAAQRENLRRSGLEVAPRALMADALAGAARIEDVTAVLLLTAEDDFNALAAVVLADLTDGPVYRLGPPAGTETIVAADAEGQVLFHAELTAAEIDRRWRAGNRVVLRPGDGARPDGRDVLFVVRADGRLHPVTRGATPEPQTGDAIVLLVAGSGAPATDAARRAPPRPGGSDRAGPGGA